MSGVFVTLRDPTLSLTTNFYETFNLVKFKNVGNQIETSLYNNIINYSLKLVVYLMLKSR